MLQTLQEGERVPFQGFSPIHAMQLALMEYGMDSLSYEDYKRTKFARGESKKKLMENIRKADNKNAIIKGVLDLLDYGGYLVFPAQWKENVPSLVRDDGEIPHVMIYPRVYRGSEPFCVRGESDDNLHVYIPPHTRSQLIFSHPEDNRYIDILGLPNGTFNYIIEGVAASYPHPSLSYLETLSTVSFFAYDLARLNQARQASGPVIGETR